MPDLSCDVPECDRLMTAIIRGTGVCRPHLAACEHEPDPPRVRSIPRPGMKKWVKRQARPYGSLPRTAMRG
jgi:hypothetical protein